MISRLINTNSKGTSFSIIIFNCVTLMIFLFTVLKKTPLGSGTLLSVMLFSYSDLSTSSLVSYGDHIRWHVSGVYRRLWPQFFWKIQSFLYYFI